MLLVTLSCITKVVQTLVESLKNYLVVNLDVECHQMQMVNVKYVGCTPTLWDAMVHGQQP